MDTPLQMEGESCRFKKKYLPLLHSIVGKMAIPMVNSEEILAVIPNVEAIHCRHLGDIEHSQEASQYAINQKMLLPYQVGIRKLPLWQTLSSICTPLLR